VPSIPGTCVAGDLVVAARVFEEHLARWLAGQRADLLGNLEEVENLDEALREAGFNELRISCFRDRLARLLAFLPPGASCVASLLSTVRVDGTQLELRELNASSPPP
jgi:hypothetical protein